MILIKNKNSIKIDINNLLEIYKMADMIKNGNHQNLKTITPG
jgi:hypothetical protein